MREGGEDLTDILLALYERDGITKVVTPLVVGNVIGQTTDVSLTLSMVTQPDRKTVHFEFSGLALLDLLRQMKEFAESTDHFMMTGEVTRVDVGGNVTRQRLESL